MTYESYITAILTFLVGLAAKFIYDIWSDKRKQKSLIYTKTIVTSFALSKLEESIRDKTRVIYAGHPVNSIHLVRVEVENNGSTTVRNQAFTVRFDDDAAILGDPLSNSSSEDLRYVELDLESSLRQSRRFIMKALQKKRHIAWDIAVINHEKNDFTIEPGVASISKDDKETDLDVTVTITNERAELDLSARFKRLLTSLFSVFALIFAREAVYSVIDNPLKNIAISIGNVLIVIMLIITLRIALDIVAPLLEFLRKQPMGGDTITIGDISDGRGVAIGKSASASVAQPIDIDAATMNKIVDALKNANTPSQNK